LEDHVLLGPRVNLITENHLLDPAARRGMLCKPILIKRNAWIGAGTTILSGITVGKNAVVAAGAVVSRDVANNTVVGCIPAKVIKYSTRIMRNSIYSVVLVAILSGLPT
jgi:acetyltransferase-like isoleucine patch superfamily enzyme